MNIVKPGSFACFLAFWLMSRSHNYPILAMFMTIDIFFDHNFYAWMVDWKGFTEPLAMAMTYFANVGCLFSFYDLTFRLGTIPSSIGMAGIGASGAMIGTTLFIHGC